MTTFHDEGFDFTFKAKTDLNSYQYHFVQSEGPASGSVGLVNVASGGSNPGPLGVLQNDPNVDEEAAVRVMGGTYLYVNACGSTICQGRYLTCGSDGHGEPTDYASGGTGSPIVAHAIAMGYTTSDGVLMEVLLNPGMLAPTAS